MKEELQNKLVEILTSIQTATGKAADFAMAELPDIAQQYVTFGRVGSVLLTLAWVALLSSAFFCIRRVLKLDDKNRYETTTEQGVLFAYSLIAGILGFIVCVASIENTVMVWAAPKVWLLKEIAHLIK